jgi:hypothetical protein
MRRPDSMAAAALLLSLLAACAAEAPAPASQPPADGLQAVAGRAPLLGGLMRAALACGLSVSMPAQDRAAAIEAAALAYHQREGGPPARDAYLRSLQPPAFDPRLGGRDRGAWCARQGTDMARVLAWLEGAEGADYAARAEAAAAAAAGR